MRFGKWLVAAVAFLCGPMSAVVSAAAQDYPNRPVTLIVPFVAGGPGDIIARLVAELRAEVKYWSALLKEAGVQPE